MLRFLFLYDIPRENGYYVPKTSRGLRGAWHGDDMRTTRDDPSDGKLSGGDSLLVRDGLHRVDEGHVVLEVLLLETTEGTAHVAS